MKSGISSATSARETTPPVRACDLCGLPSPGDRFQREIGGAVRHFCCPGCQHVYDILHHLPGGPPADFRDTDLFRECMAAGIVPGGREDPSRSRRPSPDPPRPDADVAVALAREMTLKVEGMWCPACAWLIEKSLQTAEGMVGVEVNFLADMATVRYFPFQTSPAEIRERIARLGYRADDFSEASGEGGPKKEMLFRLGVAAILTMNIMMISFALYYGFIETIEAAALPFLSWPLLMLTTPVLFYSGLPILTRAWAGIRHRSPSMETLIAIGALSAFGYSLWQMKMQSLHLYFDTASMLITLVLLGKYIETSARERVSAGISSLYRFSRMKVRLTCGGFQRWVIPEAVDVGAGFTVEAGERIPLDGKVVGGRGRIDLSFLTGETRPLKVAAGQEVLAGATLLEGKLFLEAVRPARESALNQMVRLMQEALGRQNALEIMADRITRRLVPLILVLAAGTFMGLLFLGVTTDEALLRGITVLVITCPCALGIATPLAKVAALGLGRRRGILIRDVDALEKVNHLDAVLFDKTGTLTEGRFHLRQTIAPMHDEKTLLQLAASLEIHADHFLAREIVRRADRLGIPRLEPDAWEALEGLGMRGKVDGRDILIGGRKLLEANGLALADSWEEAALSRETRGRTVVFLALDGVVAALFVFGDPVHTNARDLVTFLRKRGVRPWLISGDSPETTAAVARELGVERYAGGCLPQDKAGILKNLQEEGLTVAMVGDGINDAAALAGADVGIAMGAGTDLLRAAADLTLSARDPLKIQELFRLAGFTGRIIRQNLFFAFFYNALGIPLAVAGLLNPFLAVTAMFMSSLTVIGNTLRISRLGTDSNGKAGGRKPAPTNAEPANPFPV